MDDKQQKVLVDDMRLILRQIAAELTAAAEGAEKAAAAFPSKEAAWTPVQQMYTRLDEANHLIGRFKNAINEAVAANAQPK